jgi:hypothetical protein
VRLARGIDSRLEGYIIRGGETKSFGHVNNRINQTAEAVRITKAKTAEARSSQRVCTGAKG